jgi:hypothetical protein
MFRRFLPGIYRLFFACLGGLGFRLSEREGQRVGVRRERVLSKPTLGNVFIGVRKLADGRDGARPSKIRETRVFSQMEGRPP